MPFQFLKLQKIPLFLCMLAIAVVLGACISLVDVKFNLYLTILLIAFLLSTSLSVIFKHPKSVIQIIFFALSIRVLVLIALKIY